MIHDMHAHCIHLDPRASLDESAQPPCAHKRVRCILLWWRDPIARLCRTTSLLCTLPLSCCASMVRVACLGAGYGTYATMLVGPFDANDLHDARLT